MKKVFVEPKMNRIELNLKENIAYSIVQTDGYCVHGNDNIEFCVVHDTGMNGTTLLEKYGFSLFAYMAPCKTNGSPGLHENETLVPEEVVMRYVRGKI